MLTEYKAVDGQSIYDICLNTYGSLEYLSKLMTDSGIVTINDTPKTGQSFWYDQELKVDDLTTVISQASIIRYATLQTD